MWVTFKTGPGISPFRSRGFVAGYVLYDPGKCSGFIFINVTRDSYCEFKVANPGFSLTIPNLFEHEILKDASNETENRVIPICRV